MADGVVLCGLLEAVLPGSCPRFDLLPNNNPETNFRIASRLAAAFLGVTEVTEGDRGGWERRDRKGGGEVGVKKKRKKHV